MIITYNIIICNTAKLKANMLMESSVFGLAECERIRLKRALTGGLNYVNYSKRPHLLFKLSGKM